MSELDVPTQNPDFVEAETDWQFWCLLLVCLGLVAITIATGSWAYAQYGKISDAQRALAEEKEVSKYYKELSETVAENLRTENVNLRHQLDLKPPRVTMQHTTMDGLTLGNILVDDSGIKLSHLYILQDDDWRIPLIRNLKSAASCRVNRAVMVCQ